MLYPLFFQILFQPVGNVSLGNAAQVYFCLGILQCDRTGIFIHQNLPVIYMGAGFFDCPGIRNRMLRKIRKIPKITQRRDGDVKFPAGKLTVSQSQSDQIDRFL